MGKAPGVDGIPSEVISRAYMKAQPTAFARMADQLLRTENFPTRWKTARLVSLPKPDKPPDDPGSYRPLCLLETAGKAFEILLANRLTQELEERGALSMNQYGFRRGRSMVDAVLDVLKKGREARSKTWRTRRLGLLILVDVRNAFNSVPWEVVMDA